MPSSVKVVVMVSAAMLVCAVNAYPGGPPLLSCTTMYPSGHGSSTLTGSNPFTISTTNSSYTPGEQIEVTVSGANFIGFFVQARRRGSGSDMDQAIGTFGSIDTTLTKTVNCGGSTGSAWSHKTNAAKTSVTATWTAPSGDEGPIAFRATVVQGPSSDKYWTDIYSSNIASPSGGVETTPGMQPSPTSTGSASVIKPSVLLILVVIATMSLRVLQTKL